MRVGIEREHHFPDDVDPALSGAFERAIEVLEDLGATTVDVSLPNFEEMRAATLVAMFPEALAYHRGDLQDRWEDYYASTRINLAFGALVASQDYVQAQRARRATKRKLAEIYRTVDVIVSPTSPTAALLIAETSGFLIPRLLRSSFTAYWNAVGQPALAIPMGFNGSSLPQSLQIAGRPFEDGLVLRVGDAYQSATDWHMQLPPVVGAVGATW